MFHFTTIEQYDKCTLQNQQTIYHRFRRRQPNSKHTDDAMFSCDDRRFLPTLHVLYWLSNHKRISKHLYYRSVLPKISNADKKLF
jgi:hypothetical protein